MDLAELQAAAGLHTPIRHQLFIDGQFIEAESGETLATLNPHDNSVIVEVAMAGHQRTMQSSSSSMVHGLASTPSIPTASS